MADWFDPKLTPKEYVDATLPQLKTEMDLLVDDPPDIRKWETKARQSQVHWLSRALVDGVEHARKIHPQIKYEAEEEDKAKAALEHIAALEEWIKGYNAKFTFHYVEPRPEIRPEDIPQHIRDDPDYGDISQEILDMAAADQLPLGFDLEWYRQDPRFIDTDLVKPAFDLLKERARFRMKVARKEKRYTLAGAKRETGGSWSTARQHAAAARYGSGEMGRIMISMMSGDVPGWRLKKPTTYQLKILASIAQKLFNLDDLYSPKQMAHYIATAIEINNDRGEEGFWFGDS